MKKRACAYRTKQYLWYFVLLIFFSKIAFAEEEKYVKEYTYYASEYDSKVSSRSNALEQVKSLLLGEVATYVKSSITIVTTNDDEKYNKDILTITGGITKLKIVDESWNGELYWVKAVIRLNPKDVNDQINKILNNKKIFDELENERKKSERILEETKMLHDEIKQLKTKNDLLNSRIFSPIVNIPDVTEGNVKLSDIALSEKLNKLGETAYHKKKLEESVILYSAAVRINPLYAQSYSNLALSYQKTGDIDTSIAISRMAISTAKGKNKKRIKANTYYNIGRIYEARGDYKKANLNYLWASLEIASPIYQRAIIRTNKI